MKISKRRQFLVVTLIVALVALFSMGATSFATSDKDAGKEKGKTKTAAEAVKGANDNSGNKQVVYIMQDADGSENQRIVSTHDELHYKGYDTAMLPVSMKITYKLDGKEIEAKDLDGKKGNVSIHISYTNHIKNTSVYTPFLCLTGMMLDDETVSNVKVDHGEVTDDGAKAVVLGYALPGLAESLGVDAEAISGFSLPSDVTISFDTDKYEESEIYSVVTTEPFKDLDIDGSSDLNDLAGKIDKVRKAAAQLTKGTAALSEGSDKVANGAEKLSDASVLLSDNAKKLADGSKQMDDQVPSLVNGAGLLSAGAKKVSDGNAALYQGLSQLYGASPDAESGVEGSGTQLLAYGSGSLANGISEMQKSTEQLAGGANQMTQTLEQLSANSQKINQLAGVANTIANSIQSKYSKASEESLQAAWANYDKLVKEDASEEDIKAARAKLAALYEMDGGFNAIAAFEQTYGQYAGDGSALTQYTGAVDQLAKNAPTISNGVSAVNDAMKQKLLPGAKSVQQGVDSLNGAMKETILPGAADLADGSEKVASSAALLQGGGVKLAAGSKQIAQGSKKLADGAKDFSQAQERMADGASSLAKGAKKLDQSVAKAAKEGRKYLNKLDESGALNLLDNAKAVGASADAYQSFGGGGPYKSVTFIYKVNTTSEN